MSFTDLNPPDGSQGFGRGNFGNGSAPGRPGILSRAEDWLDERGKGAWIAAVILGFILFWPVGLAFLAYMIWSKRMFKGSCGHHGQHHRQSHGARWRFGGCGRSEMHTTGNTAFDSYKADTLRRLEEEQQAFEAFLQRLRDAKDKSEFDQFMEDRAARAQAERAAGRAPDDDPAA